MWKNYLGILCALQGPRLRVSILTGSVHLVEFLLQELAKSAHKVFDSPTQRFPNVAYGHTNAKAALRRFAFVTLRRIELRFKA